MGLIITLVLGLFIIVGALITTLSKNNKNFIDFSISLAFSVMIMLIITDLAPELIEIFGQLTIKNIMLGVGSIIVGIVILKVLDLFIPDHDENGEEQLVHIGLISSIALVVHNIIEGMAVYTTCTNSLKLGILISIGVGLHNIPLGMVITSTFYKTNQSIHKTFLIVGGLSLSTFAGGILMFLLNNTVNETALGILLGITLGMLIYISIFELLPKIVKIKNKKIAISGLLLGIILLLITMII